MNKKILIICKDLELKMSIYHKKIIIVLSKS